MSRWAVPEANTAAHQRGGYRMSRWAVPEANTAAHGAEVIE
jgi:hypothetical protein